MRTPTFSKGITIVEVTVTAFLVMILGITFWSAFRENFTLSRRAHSSLVAQQELQILGRRFSAEVREARQSETGSFAIGKASTTEFIFFADADNDGLAERIRYFVSGTELRKGVVVPTGSPSAYVLGNESVRTVIRNLVATTTSAFQYYDGSYTGTSSPLVSPFDPAAVRLVHMTLVIDDDITQPPEPVVSTTHVTLRTLKDNL